MNARSDAQEGAHPMRPHTQFLGIVEGGALHIVSPCLAPDGAATLTGIPARAAQPPESGAIDLSPYEGQVVLVRGHDGGQWIHSAEVVGPANPLVTAVVRNVLGQESAPSTHSTPV